MTVVERDSLSHQPLGSYLESEVKIELIHLDPKRAAYFSVSQYLKGNKNGLAFNNTVN